MKKFYWRLSMDIKKIIKIYTLLILLVISIGIVSATENMTDDTISTPTNDTLGSSIDLDNYSSTNQEPLNATNQDSISTTNREQQDASNQELLSYDDNVADKVEQSTKADRTFKIGKYKITLNKEQYSNFAYIKNTEEFYIDMGYNDYYDIGEKFGDTYYVTSSGLRYNIEKYTGKTVKQKIGIGFKGYKYKTLKTFKTKNKAKKYYKKHKLGDRWPYDYSIKKVKIKNKVKYRIIKGKPIYKKIKTKKAKVYISICYGEGQCGFRHKFYMYLTTNYQNPGYDVVSGWIYGSKISKSLYTLNSAKLKK